MRKHFQEHFKPSEEEHKDIWSNAIFVLDTNILINFYRYSDNTRQQLFAILQSLKSKVWIPYWVGQEFFKNRLPEIRKQYTSYQTTVKKLEEVVSEFDHDRQHPFVDPETLYQLKSIVATIKEQIIPRQEHVAKRFTHDEILDEIESIIGEQIGDPYSEEKLAGIAAEGETRYANKIPPGFQDRNKGGEVEINKYSKYGDLIIWNQLMDKAKDLGRPVIFISDDTKSDWILEFSGRKIGPLPQLMKEFNERTGQWFRMYSAEQFVKNYSLLTDSTAEPSMIDELKTVRESSNYSAENATIQEPAITVRIVAYNDQFFCYLSDQIGRPIGSSPLFATEAECEEFAKELRDQSTLRERISFEQNVEQNEIRLVIYGKNRTYSIVGNWASAVEIASIYQDIMRLLPQSVIIK